MTLIEQARRVREGKGPLGGPQEGAYWELRSGKRHGMLWIADEGDVMPRWCQVHEPSPALERAAAKVAWVDVGVEFDAWIAERLEEVEQRELSIQQSLAIIFGEES